MNIEDIKKRIIKHRATQFDTAVCNHYQFSSDVEYLLSIIEQAEKALTYYAEEPYLGSIGYSTQAVEALKAIRGN